MESILREIIEGVSNNYGKSFFETITLKMHQVIGADFTFIARLDIDAYVSRTIALAAGDEIVDNMEYSLEHTPCANVADNSVCMYPDEITRLFPDDQLLIDMGIEGYIGTPLHDANGHVMGLTVALYKKPIENPEFIQTVFQVFSGRIAAEIDRMEYAQALEEKVLQRTQHLEDALTQLKLTQKQLIHQEKLASLGGVVAGVAHEINTPLGLVKTSTSFQRDLLKQLAQTFETQSLTLSGMKVFIEKSEEASTAIELNLERAIDLVNNFKFAAVDRIDGNLYEHQLNQFMQHLLTPLSAEFERNNIQVQSNIPSTIKIITFGSDLSQVLNNLIMNASVHAFTDIDHPLIVIDACEKGDKVIIEVKDNGVGIDESIRDSIYEPFVTTKRNHGSTGLGMNIVHNLVTGKLGGEICLLPSQQGTIWQITLPKLLDDQAIFSQKVSQR